ncbi:low molecular weight phosphotyrosine protein phosphatase, partial [Bacteroides sp. OttesenSCG-928-J23]|nr:low molecular weight phosphotyrosine protein phosphatase [Bacteroides sp. OttesenSCG-928-J23]
MKRILFVCLGNICRSPMAEGVMLRLLKEAGLESEYEVDSAGTAGYHEGELADSRMRMHASKRGYNLTHRSRPVRTEDFYEFDLIIGMDDN